MTKQTIAVFGGAGSQTDLACRRFFDEKDLQKKYKNSMKEVCEAVGKGDCEIGILPVYNTVGGEVPESLESIEKSDGLEILQRKLINIRHFLVGIEGSSLDSITEVQSHWQALKQCEVWIEGNLPDVKQEPSTSTKQGALNILEAQDNSKACICPEQTARSCGLSVLQSDIQQPKNKTEFVIVAKKKESA